jgi:hypothetical protein
MFLPPLEAVRLFEKGGPPRLSLSVKHPIKFIIYVAVQLSADQPFLRGQHIVIFQITGAGGIKKSNFALIHYHYHTGKH